MTELLLRRTANMLVMTFAAMLASASVEWTQTARNADGTLVLLQDMPSLKLEPAASAPERPLLVLDRTKKFQEFAGFGGAFTEAAAINWRKLPETRQKEVIARYFGPPEEGGLGYTLGRVPINSCDFSPASYNFDDVPGDVELTHFDTEVTHDVEAGMVDMIKAAQSTAKARGHSLRLVASPWSPPAWMKRPVYGVYGDTGNGVQSMTASAKPSGLLPSMGGPWAQYFAKWITAYNNHGIDVWAVTVQNEPEATAGWEAMLWTPESMANFVRDHLGPTLHKEHPNVKIIGFDHNKDHVLEWTKGLYADPEARKYFDGVGVHWYGGLNTQNLDATHEVDPSKFILATEACNCVGNVVYSSPSLSAWWTRAEKLALDILEDLLHWAVGWIDWNLLVDTSGGPNHLKNLCDANIIVDPDETKGYGTPLITQASYYFMGHFSRYIQPGMRRVGIRNLVETELPLLSPADVKNGVALSFKPCDATNLAVQLFERVAITPADVSGGSPHEALVARGTNEAPGSDGYQIGGECVEHCLSGECWFPKVQLWACTQSENPDALHGGRGNQQWVIEDVPGGGVRLVNPPTTQCLTAVKTQGWAVGLDAGAAGDVVAAQLFDCYPPGTANQTFVLQPPDEGAPGGGDVGEGESSPVMVQSMVDGTCMQPELERLPKFDAVAFEDEASGEVALVVLNTNDEPKEISVYDEEAKVSIEHVVPPHAIHTYRWTPPQPPHKHSSSSAASSAAAAAVTTTAVVQLPGAFSSSSSSRGGAGGGGGSSAFTFGLGMAALVALFISTLAKPAARSVAEWIHEVWTTNGSGAAPLGSGAWPLATTVEMAEADEMEEEQRYVAL